MFRKVTLLGVAVALLGGAAVAPALSQDSLSGINSESITMVGSFIDPNLTGSSKSRLSVVAAGVQMRLTSTITLPEDMLVTPDAGLLLIDKSTDVSNYGDISSTGYFELDGYRTGDQSTFSVDACGGCLTFSIQQMQ